MVEFRFRSTESLDPVTPELLWDTVYINGMMMYDWTMVPENQIPGTSTTPNTGGMLASQVLNTAVRLQLGTWARAKPGDPVDAGSDPMGWWGSSVDVLTDEGEGELGSRLWLLYRSKLDATVAQKAVFYAQECLQTLIKQGAVSNIVVTSDMEQIQGVLLLTIALYSPDGSLVFKQQYGRMWAENSASYGAQY